MTKIFGVVVAVIYLSLGVVLYMAPGDFFKIPVVQKNIAATALVLLGIFRLYRLYRKQ